MRVRESVRSQKNSRVLEREISIQWRGAERTVPHTSGKKRVGSKGGVGHTCTQTEPESVSTKCETGSGETGSYEGVEGCAQEGGKQVLNERWGPQQARILAHGR